MSVTGFEPAHLTIIELESIALNRSATLTFFHTSTFEIFFISLQKEKHMWVTSIVLVLTFPNFWIQPSHDDGGCGVLVTDRTNDDGMSGNGYAFEGVETVVSGEDVLLPTSGAGWFATTQRGRLTGTGTTACEDKFRYASTMGGTIQWSGDEQEGIFEVAWATCSGVIRYRRYIVQYIVPPSYPSPSPSFPPLLSPSPPPFPLLPSSFDVVVIGCGLSGAMAFAVATTASATNAITTTTTTSLVCPSVDTTTSARSGNGWLLLPPTHAREDVVVRELMRYAQQHNVTMNTTRAHSYFVHTPRAIDFLRTHTPYDLTSVPALVPDILQTSCDSVTPCCDTSRHIQGHGDFSCDESQEWYWNSSCCEGETHLSDWSTWPTYLHLQHSLRGAVQWFVSGTRSNVPTIEVVQNLLSLATSNGGVQWTDTVESVTKNEEEGQPYWKLSLASGELIEARKVIFANGGFGAHATIEELGLLRVTDVTRVHASSNTRLLRDTGLSYGWPQDPVDAWFLEMTESGTPQWFLWDDSATVVDPVTKEYVYDESASYDERGRVRRSRNASEVLTYMFRTVTTPSSPSSSLSPSSLPIKRCDTRSKRLWRNYLPAVFGLSDRLATTLEDCSRRVDVGTDVYESLSLYQGIIDTNTGPRVDASQRVLEEDSVYAVGNAASPALFPTYVGPGSTLGNAFVTGWIAGSDAISPLP